jgi:6-phosphogluconolactonase (cycloisomerase 2 family)
MQMTRRWLIPLGALAALAFPATAAAHGGRAVFTLANGTSGNRVLAFARAHDGSLSPAGSISTGGAGTGVTAKTQGSIALSPDGRRLYAVNGGSGTIAVFAVRGTHLTRLAVVPSGGASPASVTAGHGRVYVVNGGSLNVVGFRVTGHGLRRIHHGSVALASGDAGPAQVSLNPAGTALAVTNTTSDTIDTVTLRRDGAIRRLRSFASAGTTPFGFAFTRDGVLVVSDAHQAPTSAASSYRIGHAGALRLLSGPVSANQLAACWVAIAGRVAFTANAGSGTISAFRVDDHGRLHLRGVAASPGSTSTPLDESVTANGRYMDVLTSGLHSITTYRIGRHGTLAPVGSVGGLPASDEGVASS